MSERTVPRELSAAGPSGRYELQEVLASGGMGSVYRCHDRVGKRTVAYKRLRVDKEAARTHLSALFQREYDTLARMTHPNIVEVYDYGFDSQGPYYTMELLTGAGLTSLAPLSFRTGCRLLRDVASALALLHARKLVHRDVSPNNVKLTEGGRAKLIDFGALTSFGVPSELVGTPVFVAPECLTLDGIDQRTDLYGLGALAYWTFAGRTHVRAREFVDLWDAWEEPISPLSSLVPGLPEELNELVLSLLRRDPRERPASAADVIERLTSLAELAAEDEEAKVAYSYLRHPTLIGRAQPQADLLFALRSAIAGAGQTVWLEAERGLGRSALLDGLAVQAQLAGATVVRADGGMHNTPFSAARHLAQIGLATFPLVARAMEERLTPSWLGSAGERAKRAPEEVLRSAIEASERQAAISASLAEALLQCSLQNPLVLLIDDAHLVDDESLALLASLSEPLARHPLLLVLSTRPVASAERGEAAAKLHQSAKRCQLTPLSESELQDLVSSVFGDVPNARLLALWLHAQTGGNPGHAMDVARLLLARAAIRYTIGTFVLPHQFEADLDESDHAEAALARVTGVSTSARQIASMLALRGGPLQPEQLATALGLEVAEVLSGLEELVARGAVAGVERRYSCVSEALRGALARTLGVTQTASLHLSLARALSEHDAVSLAGKLAVAEHLLAAGGAHELAGAYQLARMGDTHRFEVAMLTSALPLFERALVILQRDGLSDRECVGLLVPLTLAGFYGSLEMQKRYLDRTLHALSLVCGLSLAARLRPYLGAKLALALGLTIGFWAHLLTRRRLNHRSFVENLLAFTSVLGPATAAAASSYDVVESYRIVDYLEPLAGAPKRSGLYCIREFCIATAELIDGRMQSASRRYAYVLATFERPVLGMDDVLREQASLGCLHGRAQALVTDGSPEALQLADQLAERSTFFAPHAECVRMTYYANLGDTVQAALHRERSEAHALRSGTSWSALCTLTTRTMQGYLLVGDVVALVRAVGDLQRLGKLCASMAANATLAEAHLEQLRGQPARSLPLYEAVLATEVGRRLPSHALDVAMYAQALSALGEHQRAKDVCEALLRDPPATDAEFARVMPRQKLALAEAALGHRARAVELLESALVDAQAGANPVTLGTLHRDRAYVAALEGDLGSFEQHEARMRELFESTRNPWLIQQIEALRGLAVRVGLRAAAHAPASTSGADLDGCTVLDGEPETTAVTLAASRQATH
jgi:tRNA A-37 threonylcarbamoyl transferase component Bud32/tetratricopeptide (TPR) repeat protein